ncbi:MAG: class I SAM-dependent methyltransferase [Thermoplasmataceae archaeon]|jgi:2-polyprenyl-3-methyl-5-hydroxy-6-metoxy-1,4-benzoquinol methylase
MYSESSVKSDLYLDGEEKFGYLGSMVYNFTKASRTIRNFYKFVISDLDKHSFQSIMDVGSGRGYILSKIVEMKPQVNALGIDPSPFMVKLADKHARKLGLSKSLKFELGSSRDIPGYQTFDVIISTLSLHHWKNKDEAIAFLMKRLNPGGSLLVYEITDNGSINRKFVRSHLLNKEDFEKMSNKIGIPVTIVEDAGFIRAEFTYP